MCAAYLSQDKVLMQEIWDGVDLHNNNRERFGLPEKRHAKFFVFRLIYGGTKYAYATDSMFSWISSSPEYWQKIIDEFYQKYPGLGRWHKELVDGVGKTGTYESPTGRTYIFELNQYGKLPRTQILNYPVQGLGADLMMIARISLYRRWIKRGFKSKLVNTIHDSIVIDALLEEVEEIKNMVKQVFADVPKNFEKIYGIPFNLPFSCDFK